MGDDFPRFYKLVTPAGVTVFAAIVERPKDTLALLSTRNGAWNLETILGYADLMMPEQKLGDWDVTRVSETQVPMHDWLTAGSA